MNRAMASLTAALVLTLAGASAASAQSGPNAAPDAATLDEDTVVVVYPLLNDTDPDGGSLELVSVSDTQNGRVRIDGQAVVFTPNPDYAGSVELSYVVASASGQSTGEITITVTPVNDAPVANPDSVEAISGQPVTVDVLANDTDVEGESLTLQSISNPGNGAASVSGSSVVYTANQGFAGSDVVEYVVADASGATSRGRLTVSVSLPPPTTAAPPPTTVVSTSTAPPTTAPPATAPPTTVPAASTLPPVSIAVAAPQWEPPTPLDLTAGDGNPESFFSTLTRSLGDLYLPMLTLLVVGLAAWLLSQRGRSPARKFAVVLLGRSETLPVYDKPSSQATVIHHFGYSERQIEVFGRKRDAEGTSWLPVSTPGGRGWVEAKHLTEDVARASFESDIAEGDMVRELRKKLKAGATIVTSPRGLIDPEAFDREPSRRQLGAHATAKLTGLIGDWRASFKIDKNASIAALRPPQLRNFHWISFEAPGLDPWQLFFEYHDGHPYPVAALPETAPVGV